MRKIVTILGVVGAALMSATPALAQGANTAPTIVIHKNHWGFPPSARPDHSPFQNRCNHIVAVFENVRLNNEVFAHDSLDRIAAAIDQRLHVLDRNR